MVALSGLARLFADEGVVEKAVELEALVARHPLVAQSRWFKAVLHRPFAAVIHSLPPEVAAAAQKRGHMQDLNQKVAELLAELEA